LANIPEWRAREGRRAYNGGMHSSTRSVAFAAAVLGALVFGLGAGRADDIAWKAAHDTDPHLPLTAQQVEMTAEKRASYEAPLAPSLVCGICEGGGSFPKAASLPANQTAQVNGYYCGPAAVHEALAALGVPLSQSAAATALHTTTDGTAWSGGGTSPSGYPVPDVLNARQTQNYYVPQPVSSPSSSAIDTYANDLEADIFAFGAPLIGDAWETRYSIYHLVGHPTDRTIFHWFEIRGYQSFCATTMYEDSVHNASSISWAGSVPAYSTLPSEQIVSIVAGRGYVW
jgi:hypothetical protein